MKAAPMAIAAVLAGIAVPGFAPAASAQAPGFYFPGRATSQVRIWNNWGKPARVYTVYDWGAWAWVADMGNREVSVFRSPPGQLWKVTDWSGRTIRQFRATSGLMTVSIEKGSEDGISVGTTVLPSNRSVDIKFQNKRSSPVNVYTADRHGRWRWMATVAARDDYEIDSRPGQRWIVNDLRGRPLREFSAPGQDSKVEIR